MGKHRAKTRPTRMIAGLVTLLTVGTFTLVDSTAASSAVLATPPNKVVYAKNTVISARCALTVVHVDSTTYVTRIRLGAQQYPVDLAGYQTVAFSQPDCLVYDSTGTTLLAQFAPSRNAAARSWVSIAVDLPYDTSYILCAQGNAKLKNGDTSQTALVCG